ncbi:recombinase family protein [Ekhidna sp.]|uniref:recombinase family protein n=1 Tax=Ekhidna sp. TaxID=2608089 RepID=UPI0032F016F4
MKVHTKFVAYYRVSTQRQGASGLGLHVQKSMVRSFIRDDQKIIKEYTEIESGKVNSRPQLTAAIDYALQHNATLLIAKLDRLSRNAQFILNLRDSKVPFIAVDMPDANTLTIGLLAIIAQHEREQISERTKRALQAKKQRGYKLGNPDNLSDKARKEAEKIRTKNANDHNANKQATELIRLYKETGLNYTQIANKLNEQGLRTRNNKDFLPATVRRLYLRYLANQTNP